MKYIILALFAFPSFSQKIELSKILKEKKLLLKNLYEESNQNSAQEIQDRTDLIAINKKINNALYGPNAGLEIQDPSVTNSQNLYSDIKNKLSKDLFKEIDKIKKIIRDRKIPFDLGVTNRNGFEWQKPLGLINLYAKRDIKETFRYFKKPWRTDDHYIIEIDAETYLKRLSKAKLLKVMDADFDAFAGLKFHRKLSFTHYHQTHEEALNSKIEEFLIPFLSTYFLENLNDYEFSIKDHFVLQAKAGASLVWNPYFALAAKVSGSLETLRSSLLYQKDNKLVYKKRKTRNLLFDFSLSARVQLFEVIKLTFLDIGYNASSKLAQEKVYKFSFNDLKDHIGLVHLIANFNFDSLSENKFSPFLDTSVKYSQKSNGFHYQFLGWDGSYDSETSFTEIKNKNQKHLFGSQAYQKSKYKRTFLGAISSSLASNIPLLRLFKYYKSYSQEKVKVLFDSEDNQYYEVSINLSQYKRAKSKKDTRRVIEMINQETKLGETLPLLTLNQHLNNHVLINQDITISSFEVEKLLLDSPIEMTRRIQIYCKSIKKCFEKVNKKYNKLKSEYSKNKHTHKQIMKFVKKLLKYRKSIHHFKSFFDEQEIEIRGSLQSRISDYDLETSLGFEENSISPNRLEVLRD